MPLPSPSSQQKVHSLFCQRADSRCPGAVCLHETCTGLFAYCGGTICRQHSSLETIHVTSVVTMVVWGGLTWFQELWVTGLHDNLTRISVENTGSSPQERRLRPRPGVCGVCTPWGWDATPQPCGAYACGVTVMHSAVLLRNQSKRKEVHVPRTEVTQTKHRAPPASSLPAWPPAVRHEASRPRRRPPAQQPPAPRLPVPVPAAHVTRFMVICSPDRKLELVFDSICILSRHFANIC